MYRVKSGKGEEKNEVRERECECKWRGGKDGRGKWKR